MINKLKFQLVESCPLCKSINKINFPINIENYTFGNAEISIPSQTLTLSECVNCGLWYKNYIPTRRSLKKLFDEEAKNVWVTKRYSFLKEIKVLSRYINKEESKLIDIGSSDGGFLKKVSNLVSVKSALDVYKDYQCSAVVNGEYIIDFIEKENLESKYHYDVATAFDVFEHFYDPIQAVFNCKKLLKNNGVILGETGITDYVTNPETWWYVRLIEHHIFWNKKSFEYLQRLGLKLEILYPAAHKGRRYMNPLKRIIALLLHSTSRIKVIRQFVRKFYHMDITMIGNPYKKDHAIFVLKSYDQ